MVHVCQGSELRINGLRILAGHVKRKMSVAGIS